MLSARPRSPSHQKRLGYSGSWDPAPSQLSNKYFKLLLEQDWKVRPLSMSECGPEVPRGCFLGGMGLPVWCMWGWVRLNSCWDVVAIQGKALQVLQGHSKPS